MTTKKHEAVTRERRLRNQIEQILDTGSGDFREVIVRMEGDPAEEAAMLGLVAESMRRRRLSTSSRDVLPVCRAALKAGAEGGPRSAPVRRLRQEDRSLAAQITAYGLVEIGLQALRATALSALEPLLQADVVKQGVAAFLSKEDMKSTPRRRAQAVTPLWTSSSAVLTVRENDLKELAQSVEGVEDIYPNRRLFVPPVVAPKQVAAIIEDNKASAWGVRRIGALAVWGAYGARGEGVTVGVLDTGVDATHPDLKGKIAAWAEFDGYGKAVAGSKPHDTDQHGTHCAGTIVGGNASGRWIGVAPDARIAAALVLDGAEGGTDAQVLAGIQWAIEQQVDVISMSLGGLVLGPEVPSTYTRAMMSALLVGIPVVTAIGNEGSQTSGSPGNDFLAFAVGATDVGDRAAGFSGGRTQVVRQSSFFRPDQLPLVYSKPDVSAPGVAVLSSVPGGKWEAFNGTSMATPHVAGAIALLLSATDIRSEPEGDRAFLIQDLLTGSAEELGEAGQDHRYGFGRIDVLRAIGFAKELGY